MSNWLLRCIVITKNHFVFGLQNKKGMGTIEMIILILILIGLAVLFKKSVVTFFTAILKELDPGDTIDKISIKG